MYPFILRVEKFNFLSVEIRVWIMICLHKSEFPAFWLNRRSEAVSSQETAFLSSNVKIQIPRNSLNSICASFQFSLFRQYLMRGASISP